MGRASFLERTVSATTAIARARLPFDLGGWNWQRGRRRWIRRLFDAYGDETGAIGQDAERRLHASLFLRAARL